LIPKNRGLKIACLNITSLNKHIDELRICLNDREADILAINETRLEPDFPKELISIYGYNWIGRDRNRHGGGIGFYIRDTLNYRVRSDLNNTDIEVLTIEISKYKTN
jgi:exonuclease III